MIFVDDWLQYVDEKASSSDISQFHFYERLAKDFVDNEIIDPASIPTSLKEIEEVPFTCN